MKEIKTTTADATLADKIDRLESLEAIRQLAYTYCHGLDRRDIDAFTSVWHPDAKWVLGPESTFSGIDAIRETVAGIWSALAETHHWTSNLAIDIEGDQASATCDVDATVRDNEGAWSRAAARYDDLYERRDGRWRMTQRVGVVEFQEPFASP